MRSGYKITLGVLTIMILVTITIGTSYSYYSVASKQTTPNEITTTCFQVNYVDGDSITMNANGTYAYPMSEQTALSKVKPYTFTITNTCTTSNAKDPIHYKVTLKTLTSPISNLTPSLRYKLNETSPTSKENPSAMLTTASTYDLGSIKSEYNIDTTYNLIDGTLAPGESVTYNLYLWIDENAGNDIMRNTFTGKVLIYNYM